MNKAQLFEHLATENALGKEVAGTALDSIVHNIISTLKKGDKVTFVGFGTFAVYERAARTGHNPQTGQKLKIKSTRVPEFKAGKDFTETIAKVTKA